MQLEQCRHSNYIWVINNLIAFLSATYIRDLTVVLEFGLEYKVRYDHDPSKASYRWLSAKQQNLQCVSNGDTAVLH